MTPEQEQFLVWVENIPDNFWDRYFSLGFMPTIESLASYWFICVKDCSYGGPSIYTTHFERIEKRL